MAHGWEHAMAVGVRDVVARATMASGGNRQKDDGSG